MVLVCTVHSFFKQPSLYGVVLRNCAFCPSVCLLSLGHMSGMEGLRTSLFGGNILSHTCNWSAHLWIEKSVVIHGSVYRPVDLSNQCRVSGALFITGKYQSRVEGRRNCTFSGNILQCACNWHQCFQVERSKVKMGCEVQSQSLIIFKKELKTAIRRGHLRKFWMMMGNKNMVWSILPKNVGTSRKKNGSQGSCCIITEFILYWSKL